MAYRNDGLSHPASGAALLDRAVLETLAVRETLFAAGDAALVELADTLLMAIGQVAAGLRADTASRARLPVAA